MIDMQADEEYILDEFEQRLTNAGAGLDLMLIDRVSFEEAANNARLLRGVHVEMPTTTIEDSRNQDDALVRDTVNVTLLFRLNTKDQKASRNQALRLGTAIRRMLTSTTFHGEWHITYRTTTFRGASPKSAEVYQITQQFTTLRDAELGAGLGE